MQLCNRRKGSIIQFYNQIGIFLLGMKQQRRLKEQPFYVKRIRLRKSILKTHEILDTISLYDSDAHRYNTITQAMKHQEPEMQERIRKATVDHNTVNEMDFFGQKTNKFNLRQMKNLLKMCQHKKEKEAEAQMNVIGLEVRRIYGDPSHRKNQNNYEDAYKRNKSAKTTKRPDLTFLTISKELSADYFDANTFSDILSKKTPSTEKYTHTQDVFIDQIDSIDQNEEKCMTSSSPNRKIKTYLYQKMAGSEKKMRDKSNQVYEKRIRSYTEFLWKMMLAHSVYLNLDLELGFNVNKKMKAFVGYGNNCNMIKGLLKRRFWWTVTEDFTEDCFFAWTQIKINKIFEKQESAKHSTAVYKHKDEFQIRSQLVQTCQSTFKRKGTQSITQSLRRGDKEKFNQEYEHHLKIWSKADKECFQTFFEKAYYPKIKRQQLTGKTKEVSYLSQTNEIKLNNKEIELIDDFSVLQNTLDEKKHNYYRSKPIVHNHLQNNFFLGNKKALFYNLRDYYGRIGEDVFNYVPLTFHIKNGFKDPQYKRFSQYFENRAKIIRKQEDEGETKPIKARNIWIVKPGENTNQGRGITVIDEIYELNTIIKATEQKSKSPTNREEKVQQSETRTFIVQMYIDRPFLYNERKFDIRHYMLITNLYGTTRAYWYEQGYIRTSAYLFNISTFEPEIHLTNDAIQKHYPDYGKYEPYNKLSYSEFQNYLNISSDKKYNFKEQILPKMKKMAQDAARSVYTKISPKQQMNNFEIFGLDFMIDRNFRPWLIEINTNPCLDCACPLLDRIIPYMVEQAFKLSLDVVYPPPSHYPNSARHYAPYISLQTFKYQLIFDSQSQGQALQKLYAKGNNNMLADIGQIEEDEQFKDNGKEIKLEDFT